MSRSLALAATALLLAAAPASTQRPDSVAADSVPVYRLDGGCVVVDLRLGYTATVRRFQIVPLLGLNNLFDIRYNSSVVVNAVGRRHYEPAPGRNVYLGLRLGFR